jgi:hypothetical protein
MKAYLIIYLLSIIDIRTRHSNNNRQNSNFNDRNTATNISIDEIGQNSYLF